MLLQTKSIFIKFFLLPLLAALFVGCRPEAAKEENRETISSADSLAKREAWRENKYSMFIHFGVYSELGGVWNGQRVEKGYSEQIRAHSGMYSDEYEAAARAFNPRRWNPDSIAALARDAGMRSVVITAKHHDGFCLFKSATTPFNIVDFTPYKRDIIAELAHSCDRMDLDFGVYFSVIDWHLPPAAPISSHNADPIPPAHHQINLEQVRELMTNYGPISEIWFDMGANTPEQSKELTDLVHQLQPGCMVSGRVGNDQGDFNVMGDNTYPGFKMNVPWQTPASMFDETWGYRSWQERGSAVDKAREKLRSFVKVLSHGGNYLLNIGPKGDGSLVPFEKQVLKQIGRWVKVNKDAIYGAAPNPFNQPLSFGEATVKGNKLYLFVDSLPPLNRLTLPGLLTGIEGARFLGSGIPVNYEQQNNRQAILWTDPAMADPMALPVVEVTLKEAPRVTPFPVVETTGDELLLTTGNAMPIRSFTGSDYYTLIPSVTGLTWNYEPPASSHRALITFTGYEQGRKVILTTAAESREITLKGKTARLIKNEGDSIQTALPMRSQPFTGGLSTVHVDVNGTTTKEIDSGRWSGPDEINADSLPPLPRTAHYHLVKIVSENAQQFSFTVQGNDGLQVWINGQEQLLHRNMVPGSTMERTLVVPLNKGDNRLLIKNYNRYGSPDQFAFIPNPDAKWHTQEVPLRLERETATLTLKPAEPATPHAPIDLPNLSITILSSNK